MLARSMYQKSFLQKSQLKHIIQLTSTKNSLFTFFNLAIEHIGFCANPEVTDFLNFIPLNKKSPELLLDNKIMNTELLFSFFPQISFNDLFSLLKLTDVFDETELLKKYQIQNAEKVMQLLEESTSWKPEITGWCLEKKVKPQELLFLLNLNLQERLELLAAIANSGLSKSQSLQFLEWCSDLILLNTPIPGELIKNINDNSLAKIKSLRFPKSIQQHPLLGKKIHWGTGIQGQFLRKQDRAGFQVQFFVSSSEELTKIIHQLQKNQSEWTET